MRPPWEVYALASVRVLRLRRTRGGALVGCNWWSRRFYTLDAALEQARWCHEAWPLVTVRVGESFFGPDGRVGAPPVFTYNPPDCPHGPALACGCTRSLPPCSLNHAVAVAA